MAVLVSGMFGNGKTYFADSPVLIDVSGLDWGRSSSSPFTVVRIEVLYNGLVVGDFRADTGGQSSISFDISSALRSIWSVEDFRDEVADAQSACGGSSPSEPWTRGYKSYSLIVYTEYIDSRDGTFTTTSSGIIPGGRCMTGGLTEWERSLLVEPSDADASHLSGTNRRNGDASTKPVSSPERVGRHSITSWVDIGAAGTQSVFYPSGAPFSPDSLQAHAPIVLRDPSVSYVDFLFLNRRGAVETCSALMLESESVEVSGETFARSERPSFRPSRSLMTISSGGRKSWSMSSGYQVRDWARWWAMEFLRSRLWWMRYPIGEASGRFVPVVVKPSKSGASIYDRSKQQMQSVDFTVTMGLEG